MNPSAEFERARPQKWKHVYNLLPVISRHFARNAVEFRCCIVLHYSSPETLENSLGILFKMCYSSTWLC